MKTITVPTQIKNNLIAIISLFVAITALSYNTWRNELTEKNRTTRAAAFEVLKELGQLQIIINYTHYLSNKDMGNSYLGWGHIAFINDLSHLLPSPVPNKVKILTEDWGKNWGKIKTDDAVAENISNEIDGARESVLEVIRQLK